MTINKESLVAAARACCERSHAPYSGVHVCAAVQGASGAMYLGNNVENAAYPLGSCAETSAIAAGVQAEGAGFRIAEVAVWAIDRDGRSIAASPCGGCRQRIREFAKNGEIEIHFPWREGAIRTVILDDLLPFAFFLPAGPPAR